MEHDPVAFTQLIVSGDITLAKGKLQEQDDAVVRQDSNGNHQAIVAATQSLDCVAVTE